MEEHCVCFMDGLFQPLASWASRHHCAPARMPTSDGPVCFLPSRKSVVKMAEQNSKPSDLYRCVYSFLLENKFTKAAQQFVKQTKVVSGSPCLVDKLLDALSVPWSCKDRLHVDPTMLATWGDLSAAGVNTCGVSGPDASCFSCSLFWTNRRSHSLITSFERLSRNVLICRELLK